MKVKPLVMAVSMLVTGSVTASEGTFIYNLRALTLDKPSSWSDMAHEYTEWSNIDAPYDVKIDASGEY